MNPEDSPATAAIHLLRAALARNLRTIAYAQSRRMTELISMWAVEQSGEYADKISAYRAGFLPEERRDIESRMASEELLAVISTSALELGIDIGGLDLCILVGYPGSVMATLQRGGRVGRSGRESAVVLVAQEDALDQYIVRNPEDFFARPPECAVVNPENPVILERHLECAAAEHPLKPGMLDAAWLGTENAKEALAALEGKGLVLRSADGKSLHAARKRPQRHVDLRGAGSSVTLLNTGGNVIGSLDGVRAMREAHPGAVYIHRGRTYIVESLDLAANMAVLAPGKPAYYTRTWGNKNTEILQFFETKNVWGASVGLGKLRVTEEITEYEKCGTKDGRLLTIVPLEFDPLVFETEGLWITIPEGAQQTVENSLLHFIGSIHAVEHAAIDIMSLLVMADRNDFGGISPPHARGPRHAGRIHLRCSSRRSGTLPASFSRGGRAVFENPRGDSRVRLRNGLPFVRSFLEMRFGKPPNR
jgi:DEAD/DEAH box helicase domain-containing protein